MLRLGAHYRGNRMYGVLKYSHLSYKYLPSTGPLLGHKVTTFPGSSGSPLLREYNGKWFVIGLHRTGLDVLVENEKKELVAGPTLINLATCISEITNALSGNPYNGQGMYVCMYVSM